MGVGPYNWAPVMLIVQDIINSICCILFDSIENKLFAV